MGKASACTCAGEGCIFGLLPPPIPELLEAIRVHKDEILEALKNDRRSLSIDCLKPPEPMRTCPGCHGGLQSDDKDLALCRTCRWNAEYLAPKRVQ